MNVEYKLATEYSNTLCKYEDGKYYCWSARDGKWKEDWLAFGCIKGLEKGKSCTESEAMEIVKNGYHGE